jgi:hypothetical protein
MQTLEAQLQDEREQREAAEVEANRLRAGLQSPRSSLADAAGEPCCATRPRWSAVMATLPGDVVQQLLRDAIAGAAANSESSCSVRRRGCSLSGRFLCPAPARWP